MKLFGTSGIRRIANRDLVQLAFEVGFATGRSYGNAIVGRDTRTTSSAIRYAALAGLLSSGASCSDAGVLPTPTLAFASNKFKVGVMVTASHNPPQYNGIKLLNPDGSAFSTEQQDQIETLIGDDGSEMAHWERIQNSLPNDEAVAQHVERIVNDFSGVSKVKVVIDSGCGAAYSISPHALARIGCQVTGINCHPSGLFPHDVEPIEANLGDLMRAVKETGADLGIAHDGDADRMMAVDDKGRFISGDKMLAIMARAMGCRRIVTTIDASMSIDEMDMEVIRTRVGDPYVSDELTKGGQFGGEPSGAWVFPRVSLCPDGIYAAALIATVAGNQKLSALVDSIPSYPVLRGNFRNEGMEMTELEQRLAALKPRTISKTDGFKLNFENGWLLVRPSGTEPKIRITAEARDENLVHRLFDEGCCAVQECMKQKV